MGVEVCCDVASELGGFAGECSLYDDEDILWNGRVVASIDAIKTAAYFLHLSEHFAQIVDRGQNLKGREVALLFDGQEESDFVFADSTYMSSRDFIFAQAQDMRVIPCGLLKSLKNAAKHAWKRLKDGAHKAEKYMRHHEKEMLLVAGAIIAGAIIAGVGIAIASGTAAAASGSDDKEKEKPESKKDDPTLKTENPVHVPSESKILETTSIGEDAKALGSVIAHKTFDGIAALTSCVPQALEEIREIGKRTDPGGLLLSKKDGEINPKENYDKLVAASHGKIDQLFSTDQAKIYTPEAKEAENKFIIGILPPPGIYTKISFNINKLAEAGKAIDRAGYTKAGRNLMKHGDREGSAFPKATGNPAQVNEQGQKVLESLLTHPDKIVYERPHPDFGKVIEVAVPGKGGARFTADGEKMIGFLEP